MQAHMGELALQWASAGFPNLAYVLRCSRAAGLQQMHLAVCGVPEPAVTRAGDPALWDNVLKLNVLAPMHLMQLFAPPMQKARVSSQPEHMQHDH